MRVESLACRRVRMDRVTTVGYGDVTPRTWQGQVFTAGMMLWGIIFLAMPLTSVGNHFARVWEERQLHLLQTAMRVQLMQRGISPDDVRAAFDSFDKAPAAPGGPHYAAPHPSRPPPSPFLAFRQPPPRSHVLLSTDAMATPHALPPHSQC